MLLDRKKQRVPKFFIVAFGQNNGRLEGCVLKVNKTMPQQFNFVDVVKKDREMHNFITTAW